MNIENCHKTTASYSCQHLSQSPRFVLAVLGLLTLFACGKSRDVEQCDILDSLFYHRARWAVSF
jgi:hypothetical protein